MCVCLWVGHTIRIENCQTFVSLGIIIDEKEKQREKKKLSLLAFYFWFLKEIR